MQKKTSLNPTRVDEYMLENEIVATMSYKRGKVFGIQINCKPDIAGIKVQLGGEPAIWVENLKIGLWDHAADDIVSTIKGFVVVNTSEY